MLDDEDGGSLIQVSEMFLKSPCYSDIVYVLQHIFSPPGGVKNTLDQVPS